MKVHFRPAFLNRVRGLTFGKSPSGSITFGAPFQTVRIVSSQLVYFNSKSKPSDVAAQWEKNAKEGLKLSETGKALEFAGSDGIQPDGEMPGTQGITSAEEVDTYDPLSAIDEQVDTYDPLSAIDEQIKCAKEQLNSYAKQRQENDKAFSSKLPVIIQDISSRLDDGKVPPLFHALGMPVKWLGGKELCLKLKPVEPGDVKEDWIFWGKSILHLEVLAENKEDIVGKDLKAVKRIKESSGIVWDYNKQATAWAVNLVNTDANMRGSNVECTAVGALSTLINDASEQNLLTRPQSRGVVATICNKISTVKSETTSSITGLPGIGKSWTLLYVLQQALLYEGVFVIFKTDGLSCNLFHRRSGKIYAWSTDTKDRSKFLDSEETLFIFNPSQDGTMKLPLGSRHLIYAASNHEKNVVKFQKKKFPKMQHYVGPWRVEELKAAFHDFKKDEGLLISNILGRAKLVGGLPRYLMEKDNFEVRSTEIVKSVKELESFRDLEKSMRNATIEIDILSDTVSGSLYSVEPRRNMDFDYSDYDGKSFFYQDRVVNWASHTVFLFVVNKFRKEALTYFGKTDDSQFIEMGKAAEYWFLRDLHHGGLTFNTWKMKKNSGDAVSEISSLEIPSSPQERRPRTAFETCKYIAELFEESKNNDTFIVCPRNFPTVDAIGFGRRVFQVTVSKSHTLKPDVMKKILGILAANEQEILNGDGKGSGVEKSSKDGKISFYWVVPPGIVPHWKNSGRKTIKDDGALEKAINDSVEQFVLELPLESKWIEKTDILKTFSSPERK